MPRFARERDILATLEHPYIARLYDAGLDAQGRPYMALEFVEDRPIDVFCREQALQVSARLQQLMQGDSAVETALTRVSGRAMTPDYASPEQVRGEPQGTASDVCSLGVVTYELLAGTRPYRLQRGSAAELEEATTAQEIPAASAVAATPASARPGGRASRPATSTRPKPTRVPR